MNSIEARLARLIAAMREGRNLLTNPTDQEVNAMKFILTIDLDNAAFEHPGELPARLHEIAERVEAANLNQGQNVMDSNGNTVGHWGVA